MQATNYVKNLYQAVDDRSIERLSDFLADDVIFKLGNFPSTEGKNAVLAANENFFASIHNMQHHLDNIWQIDNTLICHGRVDYIRLDKTETSAVFSSILTLKDDQITDYLVYADLSEL